MDELLRLIDSATAEARPVVACADDSHHWQSEGGRRCPRDHDGCSQAVYKCAICGVYDYGEPGGPGARDCAPVCSPWRGDDA